MKHLIIGLSALALTACGTLAPANDQVPIAQGVATLDAAYNVAAKAYLAQLPTMPANIKTTVKPILVKVYAIDQAADTGQVLAGEASVASEIADAITLIAQAKAALGVQ